ncbi:hypothetical protein, partial [Micromonospora arida]
GLSGPGPVARDWCAEGGLSGPGPTARDWCAEGALSGPGRTVPTLSGAAGAQRRATRPAPRRLAPGSVARRPSAELCGALLTS